MYRPFNRLLVANRGEIASRIMATAADMALPTVAVYSEDDVACGHVVRADKAIGLIGRGAAAYLDMRQIIDIALREHCDAIHPGYGFLSENAEFVELCDQAGIGFVGPSAENLRRFGDKSSARTLATTHGVPVSRGTSAGVSVQEAMDFFRSLGPGASAMVKATAGGGGRGIRLVQDVDKVEEAVLRCSSEAQAAFGVGSVYLEEFVEAARHIEVQIAGDRSGSVVHFFERECSLQRQRQKMIEIAPSPSLDESLRKEIIEAAVYLARSAEFLNIGTFEFLVRPTPAPDGTRFIFMEANPRIQVEHTVTEEIIGIDLVRLQLELASGKTLEELGHTSVPKVTPGYAIQLRVNMERIELDGSVKVTGGTLKTFQPPAGPGIRVDTAGYVGYEPSPNFDALLAKVIVTSRNGGFSEAVAKAYRALCGFNIAGIETNIPVLLNILQDPQFASGNIDVQFFDTNRLRFLSPDRQAHPQRFIDAGTERTSDTSMDDVDIPVGHQAIRAPMMGTIVEVEASEGQDVARGQAVLVIEAMKMQTVVTAPTAGKMAAFHVTVGKIVQEGDILALVCEGDADDSVASVEDILDLDTIRPDLAEVLERKALWLDEARPEAVEKRRRRNRLTAREIVADILDDGSFLEYNGFVVAAQRAKRTLDDLIHNTPADGLICGVGSVNADLFGPEAGKCGVVAYDYTVHAGTQGINNHMKTDRILEVAREQELPVILYAEGGGGRPGETDGSWVTQRTFNLLPSLSGKVPLVGIAAGHSFAGNAAVLGLCDVTIVTEGSTLGMGGPVMVEGGGLGKFTPEEIGSSPVHVRTGVIDILVSDEREAVAKAKQFLSYQQGALATWEEHDQRLLRTIIPLDRRRMYDVHRLIELIADVGTVLELRRDFGKGIVTAMIRVEGRPLGVMANNPAFLGGAIDSDGADKAARFMQLCNSYGLPLLSLIDTPGIMVGPDAEKTGIIRHSSRMLVTGANLRVPRFMIVTRKGYGLGKVAMAAGSFRASVFAVAWPTGEFGPMNLEGQVRLSHRKELAAISDPDERDTYFRTLVDALYEEGSAINRAMEMEFDDVIDPAQTRKWIAAGLHLAPPIERAKREFLDTW